MPSGIPDLPFLGLHRNEDWKCTLGSSVLKDLDSLKIPPTHNRWGKWVVIVLYNNDLTWRDW